MAPKTTKPAAENADQTDATASAEIIPEMAPPAPENAANSESGADSAVADSLPPADDEAATPSKTVEVVVRAKRTVRHEGKIHNETELVELPREDAERLKQIGFVDYLDDLHKAAQATQGVNVSVNSGVAITQEA